MALEKDVNSYATVEEADLYFADRLDVAAWEGAESEQKSKALTTATALLDALDWIGTAVSENQTLAFPRTNAYYLDPLVGNYVELDSTKVPLRIVKATYEVAYHLLNNDGLLDETGSVNTLSVSGISLNVIISPERISPAAAKLIRPLLANRGSRSWWRAN